MKLVNSKKKLLLVFLAILLLFNASFVASLFILRSSDSDNTAAAPPEIIEPAPEQEQPEQPGLGEEYYKIFFNYGDAIELCSEETRSRNSNLIQLVVNEHSTRFKPEENIYLVKLDTQVGTPLLYDEKSHTCEIDPEIQGVAFYQEITRRKAVRPQ